MQRLEDKGGLKDGVTYLRGVTHIQTVLPLPRVHVFSLNSLGSIAGMLTRQKCKTPLSQCSCHALLVTRLILAELMDAHLCPRQAHVCG